MNREHFEQHAAGIDDAIARAALSLRAAANNAEDQPVDAPAGTESETARNQAANDLLHTILTARHLLIADDSRHSRDAAVSLLAGAAQAIDRMTALGTEGKASAECSLSSNESEPKPGTNDAGPVELATRLESERPGAVADAVDAAMGFAMLVDRRRLMAARGILSAVAIENEVTLAIPEYSARAIEAAMESIDAATLPENIGN